MVDEPTQIGSNPQVIANYQLGDVLGAGGMATVYEATDRRDGSKVAVKLVHSHLETDADFRERFLREAHVGALLRSPYTCQLLDFGVENSRFYLVMKLIDGEELGDMLRAGPIEPARALKIASQVARALEEAEARGVVHRDIKPSNIMVTEGDMVQVMDFGIARQTGSATLTATGAFVGTLTYAPPEAAGGATDNRSDIYSLGVTLYHMIAGRPPFEGDMITILQQHREAPLPVEPLEGLPQAVIETIGRCMEKDPNLRFQTASELAGVFEHLAEGVAAGIDTISMPETEILQPGAAPMIPSTSVRTMPLVVTMDLGAPQVRRAFLPRTGRTKYDLTFRNNSEQPVELDLQAMDAEGTCSITLPDSVTVPARSGTTVTMSVTPGERRVRGDRQLRQFSVRADAGTGTVPLMAAGEFDDRPEGFFPYAAPPAFAIALAGVVFAFLSFGGGDDAGPGPAASTTGLGGVVCSPLDTLCFGGRLLFNSERDGNLEIYVMNADGSGEIQRLTDNPGKDGDPSWSPDGSKIVFETDRHGELFEIYTMNADGSGLQRLTISDTSENQYVNVEPVWSPDGSLIAFTSTRDGNAFIYTMNSDGSDVRRLANIPGQGPDWFPDGTRIAFFSIDAASNFDVYVVTIEGGEVVRLTDDAAVDTQPAWSPDGQRIAFQSDRSGNGEIYVMNADGTEPVRLTNNPAEDTEPSWSPDGRQIVFRSSRDGNDDLYTMFADGTGQVRLTSALEADGQPAWTSGAMPVATRSETGGDLSVQDEVDYFVFNAVEGVTYTLSAIPDTLRDVHLHLWRTASREIKLTDVRGLGANSAELAWTASFSGPVFASVESYSGQIGEYDFAVQPAP
ncbi:MAG: protein kinase [Dehalococcoidia bacterium]